MMRQLIFMFFLAGMLPTANATIVNGDFADVLSVGWDYPFTSYGDIEIIGEQAIIYDDANDADNDSWFGSSLAQFQGLEANTSYRYSFDFSTDIQFDDSLCGNICFEDFFIASLFFYDSSFSNTQIIDLYMSDDGFGNAYFDANSILTNNGGVYSLEYSFFNTNDQSALVTFDLTDFDYSNNSSVMIDNVVFEKIAVTTVPEPETLFLFLIGVAGIFLKRKATQL